MAKNINTDKNTSVRYINSNLPRNLNHYFNLVKQFENKNKERKKFRTKKISLL